MQIDIALFSIKPDYADSIFSGKKIYEFRRVRPKENINYLLIYSSSPVQLLTGFAEIEEIIEGSPNRLWRLTKNSGGILYTQYMSYFNGKDIGYAIKLKKVWQFSSPVDPKTVWKGFFPPQSFRYVANAELEHILSLGGIDGKISFHRRRSRSG